MEEMVNVKTGELSVLDGLAMQARTFAQGACMNLLQLGRVLAEAKPLVPHGEWDTWVKTNAKMSRRTAEQYMQAYAEFGLNTRVAELGTTKVLKLLPMPEEEREKLLSENDVAGMSTRQLDEAIRAQREKLMAEAKAEAQKEIDKEKELRLAWEKRAQEDVQSYAKEARKIEDELRKENQRLQDNVIEAGNRLRTAVMEKNVLETEIKERDMMLEEQQADYNRLQEELLNTKSAVAKGDAERIPSDQLTADAFAAAVRAFIGTCARMPHMGNTFAGMDHEERNDYDELLRTVESWAAESRKALESVAIEGTVHIHE